MRYFHEQKSVTRVRYGESYKCDHPVYSRCTLYRVNNLGLAVIQQRFDLKLKTTYWSEIDSDLIDDIYLHPAFYDYFKSNADREHNGIYPTVTVRQIMWALKMKPLKRERWETVFDRKYV